MKQLIFIAIFCLSSLIKVSGQGNSNNTSILQTYYDIKNALVNGDAHAAGEKAGVFASAVVNLNTDKNNTVIKKLQTNAHKIAATTDLAAQRLLFAALSSDMYSFIKSTSFSKEPVYRAYCPMKKAYWLSNVQAISNPYYGRAMLTCGSVTETINPIK
ncbi:DUF3347 domain-containing protein [Mucilaginibacter gilvus]|uniref:DUF3347 domain-containing protein n=1 Tax=Mucilaginibacter gilvus TaxID=2305909 RepID=A0A3S3V286_9SPHI|nr:DUF3347 domain-containing protein [Mucilaginibacter gilvus]RWY53850.1 DUF3347 domain-containing protein [Mucilaginibacter gilvus]